MVSFSSSNCFANEDIHIFICSAVWAREAYAVKVHIGLGQKEMHIMRYVAIYFCSSLSFPTDI